MALSTVSPARWRAHRGLAALSLGMVLALAAPAWPRASQDKASLSSKDAAEVQAEAVAVDPALANPGGGALVPSGIFISEVEPNDTPATAQPLPSTPARVRAFLYRAPFVSGQQDVDVFSFTAPAGARVYAANMTSWSAGSTDSEIDIIDVDGTTVLELDDDNGTASTLSSVIAGTVLTTGGTYYVRVRQASITSLTGTHRPYDLYVQVQTGTPTAEVEPTPNPLPPSGWVSGTVNPAADSDTFTLTVNAGDTIAAILDLDPERDAPDWNGRLGIGNFNNFFLVTGDAGTQDAQPSESLFTTVKTTGTYIIYVQEQVAGVGGPASTYHLTVFVIPARNRTCTNYVGTTGPITDLGITDFTVAVPDLRSVGYLKLNLNITHADTSDLDISLISSGGNEVALWDDRTNTAGVTAPQMNFTMEDEAALPPSVFSVYSALRWTPDDANGRLEFFKGMQAQGTWTLRVRDDLSTDTGTVNAFSIDVCQPDPRPTCLIPGPAETTVFTTDFEAGDAGFTHSGLQDEWERGLPAFAPITTAHSGVNAFKTDLDGTYNSTSDYNLLSPNIALPAAGRVTLNWWQKFQMDTASNDTYWAEVREVGNPANARRLFSWTGDLMTRSMGSPAVTVQQSAGWGLVQADITDFAGLNVEVVFHLASNVSTTSNYAGVAIDDVLVTSCTTLEPSGDLAITKTNGQDTYFPGQALTYTIVASNAGPSTAIGATVTDDFPTTLTGVSWTCVASAGSACGTVSGNGDIGATVDLLTGGTATFTANATVAANATGLLINSAVITPPAGLFDPNGDNNDATDIDTFLAVSDLSITKTDGVTTTRPGQALTYTIVVTNAGPQFVTGATVADTFPADLTGVSWTCSASSGSSCGSASGSGNISVAVNLLPAGTATFTADATVSPTASGNIVNTATVTLPAGWSDPDLTNNSATDTDTLVSASAVALAVDTTGNSVYEPNETAVVAPTWANSGPAALALTGTLSNHTGPGGATYTIPDASADYGTIAVAGQASCTATGNCYSVANTMTTRPATHWDSTAEETVAPPAAPVKTWTLHIGESFTDVPSSSGFYRFIETILHKNVTGGCTLTTYCPISSTTREQMAVFVLVAKEPAGYTPPACVAGSEMFLDVPASSGFCRWIEELARRGVVAGCGGGNYCPTSPATREQMAVFVLRTLDPTLSPPACVAGSEMFADVPASSGFCRWIEELARRGVVTGCGGGNYCPTSPVTREQMSVFLAVTFSLVLYGI
jgi:uncharacterized repeat protein (TIGR01451 family)